MASATLSALVGAALTLGLVSPSHAADDLVALLLGMERAYARVTDYTARFVRRERIGSRLRPREEIFLKFRRPSRVYLRWVTGPRPGREILFVKGRDDDKILVHEPGVFSGLFTYVMAPDSPRVLKESRHPVSEAGLGRLIELLVSNTRRAWERGELMLLDRGAMVEAGRHVRQVEGVLPRNPGKGYYCYRAIVSVDLEWELPVAATIFDWDDRVVAEYAYRDLRLNPGLRDTDFDPANPEYSFPRWRLAL